MDAVSQSKKSAIVIFDQQICDQLEHIPIKKRISLRDSALYQPAHSSAKVLDQKVSCPSLSRCTDPNFITKQPSDNLLTSHIDVNRSGLVVPNNKTAESASDFSCIKTLNDSTPSSWTYTPNNGNKVPSTEAVQSCTEATMSSVSSFASDAKNDGLATKSAEHVRNLTSDVTGDSYPDGKSSTQPYPPCSDRKAVQSVTQEVRLLWDLNFKMDEWEQRNDHQNVESLSDVTSFEFTASTKLEISEDFKLKENTILPISDAETDTQPTGTSLNSGSVCEHNHIIPGSAYSLVCDSISNDQRVASGTCHYRTFSDMEPSLEKSCNQKLSSIIDEHVTPKLGESASKLSADEPKRDSGSLFELTSYYVESNELQDCENKNIATAVSSDEDNGSSKKKKNAKPDELKVAFVDSSDNCVDLRKRRSHVEEDIHMETVGPNARAASSVHQPSNRMTNNLPENVDVSMENQKLGSFQEGCDASFVEPLCMPGNCLQDASLFMQVVNTDKYCGCQTEQDFEDGELRDMDIHCWSEMETECLDYEPVAVNTENLDESSTSLSVVEKDEDQLKRTKHRSSETLENHLKAKDGSNSDKKMIGGLCSDGIHLPNRKLERKLSGWDQLPKDDCTSLDKVQEAHRVPSRILRSELQGCIYIPTLSEDGEEKEKVLERRIRPKDIDSSYFTKCGSGFDEFSGKRRFTTHMHRRNRIEDWDAEHRSSVTYHDIYDDQFESSPSIMNFKARERLRSRSPSVRSEAYDVHINYSRYSRGRYGKHAGGSDRIFRGGRHGRKGSLTDDRGESDFCVRLQYVRKDRSFSPIAVPHFSENVEISRSVSRARSPPILLPRYERMGDSVKGRRLPFWKSSFPSDKESLYASPPRCGFIPHNKPTWVDDDNFHMGRHRDRSPVRRFCNKEKFNSACSRGRFQVQR